MWGHTAHTQRSQIISYYFYSNNSTLGARTMNETSSVDTKQNVTIKHEMNRIDYNSNAVKLQVAHTHTHRQFILALCDSSQ